jgi:hypothetical protein
VERSYITSVSFRFNSKQRKIGGETKGKKAENNFISFSYTNEIDHVLLSLASKGNKIEEKPRHSNAKCHTSYCLYFLLLVLFLYAFAEC